MEFVRVKVRVQKVTTRLKVLTLQAEVDTEIAAMQKNPYWLKIMLWNLKLKAKVYTVVDLLLWYFLFNEDVMDDAEVL